MLVGVRSTDLVLGRRVSGKSGGQDVVMALMASERQATVDEHVGPAAHGLAFMQYLLHARWREGLRLLVAS
jgi:hypothetical protein